MSRSNWVQRFAGHGVLIVVGALLVALLLNIGQSQKQSPHGTQQQNTNSSLPSAASVDKPIGPKEYKADCNSEKDADLCAQRHMADTADQQAKYTLISIILLGLTFVAAGVAAREAHRIVVVTDRSARQQLRAYLHVESAAMPDFAEHEPTVNVSFMNCGQTPAYNVVSQVGAYPLPPENRNFGDGGARFNFGPIGPQQKFTVSRTLQNPAPTQDMRDQVARDELAIFVVGRIDYEDIFGKPQWLTFRCAFTQASLRDPRGRLTICEHGNEASGSADSNH